MNSVLIAFQNILTCAHTGICPCIFGSGTYKKDIKSVKSTKITALSCRACRIHRSRWIKAQYFFFFFHHTTFFDLSSSQGESGKKNPAAKVLNTATTRPTHQLQSSEEYKKNPKYFLPHRTAKPKKKRFAPPHQPLHHSFKEACHY